MNLFTLLRVVAGLTRVAQKAVRQARGKPEPAFDWSGVVFFWSNYCGCCMGDTSNRGASSF